MTTPIFPWMHAVTFVFCILSWFIVHECGIFSKDEEHICTVVLQTEFIGIYQTHSQLSTLFCFQVITSVSKLLHTEVLLFNWKNKNCPSGHKFAGPSLKPLASGLLSSVKFKLLMFCSWSVDFPFCSALGKKRLKPLCLITILLPVVTIQSCMSYRPCDLCLYSNRPLLTKHCIFKKTRSQGNIAYTF